MEKALKLTLALTLALFTAACGVKGDLKLPKEEKPEESQVQDKQQ